MAEAGEVERERAILLWWADYEQIRDFHGEVLRVG